ncbi:MAG: BsuPI-related putative proteinase inhibitor [Gemmatimonadota bacterium]
MRPGSAWAAALLVAGCAGSNGTEGRTEPEAPDLAVSLEVDVAPGSVGLALHVTNSGADPVTFTFPSSQRYDFVISTPAGEEVWRWSEGRFFTQAVTEATLAPGASWSMEAEWDPGTRTGRYTAAGVLTARDRGVRQSTAFEIR